MMSAELKRLHNLGFAIHWLHDKSKRPLESKWSSAPVNTWEDLKRSSRKGYNVGVRLGKASKVGGCYLAVIDCDVKSTSAKHRIEMTKKLSELISLSTPSVMSGRGNGSAHFYILTGEPARAKRLAQSSEKVKVHMPSASPSRSERENLSEVDLKAGYRLRAAWEISLMGEGQQVVLPPSIHPDSGKPYTWFQHAPDDETAFQIISLSDLKASSTADKPVTDSKGFTPVPYDLVSSKLPSRIVDQIVSGEGVEDRSAALLGVTNSMIRAGFTDDEILSVLTDRDNFLGETGYDHAKTKRRARAAEWVRKYALEKSKRETSAEEVFKAEVEETILGESETEAQSADLIPELSWEDQIERGGEQSGFRPKNTFKNVMIILQGSVGLEIFKRNEFANSEHYGLDAPWGTKAGTEITDIDTVRIKCWLADHFRFEPSNDRINEAVSKIADSNRYHPVRDYLDRLEWDGTPRLDNWLKNYLSAKAPEPYLSAISRKVLCAMVARVYQPGVKFDHVLILEGNQGVGKSTALRKLAGEAWFTDSHINVSDKDSVMTMRSMWLIELGELSGMRSADVELLKEFVSRTTDRIRVPYGKRTENFPRQCVFIGTTNRKEYLKDTTGNRRFWPVSVGACDFDGIEADRDQLLAEAKFAWELGEPLYLEDVEMVDVARDEQEARSVHDTVVDVIGDWLALGDSDEAITPMIDRKKFRMEDIFAAGGPLPETKMTPPELKRVADALGKLGYKTMLLWDKSTKRMRRYWAWDFEKHRVLRPKKRKPYTA